MTTDKTKKAMDAMAFALLPEKEQIAALAAQFAGEYLDLRRAKAVIRATCPKKGDLGRLAELLLVEVRRQSEIRKKRGPRELAAQIKAEEERRNRLKTIAESNFREFLDEVFSGESLSLLEFFKGGTSSKPEIEWLDVAATPVISGLCRISKDGKVGRFLLYKLKGTSEVYTLKTEADTCKDALVAVVPPVVVGLRQEGGMIDVDWAAQEIKVTTVGGEQRVYPFLKPGEDPDDLAF